MPRPLITRVSLQGGDGRAMQLACVVGEVREALRSLARDQGADAGGLRVRQLALCDRIRDQLLPPLGVRLEDRDQGEFLLSLPLYPRLL